MPRIIVFRLQTIHILPVVRQHALVLVIHGRRTGKKYLKMMQSDISKQLSNLYLQGEFDLNPLLRSCHIPSQNGSMKLWRDQQVCLISRYLIITFVIYALKPFANMHDSRQAVEKLREHLSCATYQCRKRLKYCVEATRELFQDL